MDPDSQQVPGAGPPKKGFWGFVASLIPGRPAILDTSSSTDDVEPEPQIEKSVSSEKNASTPESSSDEAAHTNEESAPNNEGDETPPTVSAPEDIKALGAEENDDFPPTLPPQ